MRTLTFRTFTFKPRLHENGVVHQIFFGFDPGERRGRLHRFEGHTQTNLLTVFLFLFDSRSEIERKFRAFYREYGVREK